jgi:hypothetical protein
VLNLGPDHFVRLTATKRLIELLVARRAAPKKVPELTRDISGAVIVLLALCCDSPGLLEHNPAESFLLKVRVAGIGADV